MTSPVPAAPEKLYDPAPEIVESAGVWRFLDWLRTRKGVDLAGWPELYDWSVSDLEGFWASIWEYFDVKTHRPYAKVLDGRAMPGARWFPGAALNYAEHCFGSPDQRDT